MVTWRPLAAANNAEWCDVVCRSHGLDPRFDGDAWTSPTRTPQHYPDAVTLVADPSVPAVLARVDTSSGCSIKDSFASLDLTAFGFQVLFDAEWIVRLPTSPPPTAPSPRWEVVASRAAFARWERAWRGDDGPPGVLRPHLLDRDSVTVVAASISDRVIAGAVLNRSTKVIGISNFFAVSGAASASWAGCLDLADTLFPGSILVGYESGDAVDAARAHGFETVGPLRVWLRRG